MSVAYGKNWLSPALLNVYSEVVTSFTTRFKFYVLPTYCMSVFCMNLGTDSDYFHALRC